MQIEIVHRADAQETDLREPLPNTIHERAARRAEIVGHGPARGDGARLAVSSQIFAAPDVGEMRVEDAEA